MAVASTVAVASTAVAAASTAAAAGCTAAAAGCTAAAADTANETGISDGALRFEARGMAVVSDQLQQIA
jgi:hypothetical protein